MKKKEDEVILALCDGEEEYASLMSEYMQRQKNLPWTVHTYTDLGTLICQEPEADIIVLAESCYEEDVRGLHPKRLIVLNESGVVRWKQVRYVNKYQKADQVVREILDIYLEIAAPELPKLEGGSKSCFIGLYSPIRRCYQTTLALTMAQLLAKNHKTLYLNFEYFVGNQELLPDMQTRDLADLLYFLGAEQDKFALRLQSMVRQVGELDYVPPMKSGQNLLSVSPGEWLGFMKKLEELGRYEYIVMDLSECMQGLFDILRTCRKVYTVNPSGEERLAAGKLLQYEKLLQFGEYEDVLQKTSRCTVPKLRCLPAQVEMYTRSELAEYVWGQIRELLKEDGYDD